MCSCRILIKITYLLNYLLYHLHAVPRGGQLLQMSHLSRCVCVCVCADGHTDEQERLNPGEKKQESNLDI